jgi:hypothetical protein
MSGLFYFVLEDENYSVVISISTVLIWIFIEHVEWKINKIFVSFILFILILFGLKELLIDYLFIPSLIKEFKFTSG